MADAAVAIVILADFHGRLYSRMTASININTTVAIFQSIVINLLRDGASDIDLEYLPRSAIRGTLGLGNLQDHQI
jgi:hypothetical protein